MKNLQQTIDEEIEKGIIDDNEYQEYETLIDIENKYKEVTHERRKKTNN